jgi:hypothetical protein
MLFELIKENPDTTNAIWVTWNLVISFSILRHIRSRSFYEFIGILFLVMFISFSLLWQLDVLLDNIGYCIELYSEEPRWMIVSAVTVTVIVYITCKYKFCL